MMGVIFKKGHIIPRWCGVVVSDRKAQHRFTFDCDVEVTPFSGSVRITALCDGALIRFGGSNGRISRRMKGGSTKYSTAHISNIIGDISKMN